MRILSSLVVAVFCVNANAGSGEVLTHLLQTVGERCHKDSIFSISESSVEKIEVDQGVVDTAYRFVLDLGIVPLGETAEVFVEITEYQISNPSVENLEVTQFYSSSEHCK